MRMALVLGFLVACGEGHRPQGQQHGPCNPDGTCDVGLVCADEHCEILDAFSPPGDGFKGDGGVDCTGDSTLEPNDTIANAFTTGVDTQLQMLNLAGLAICPATDKDTYRVTLSATKAISATVTPDAGTMNISLLNAGGTAIANGVAGTVCAPNLPVGTYFVQTSATTQLNYRLSIVAKASCP